MRHTAPTRLEQDLDLADWIDRPPSRRLRKLYAQLVAVEQAMEKVRADNPCPEHAPTALRITLDRLRPLQAEWHRLTARLCRLQGDT